MFKLLSSEVHPLTPELAKAFSEMPGSPTERDLNPDRLQHLQRKLEGNLLTTFHWAKARVGTDDLWLRVNGQHSSTMLVEQNGHFPEGLFVHVDAYHVDDVRGLALLFRQLDDRKSSRSHADVAGAYQNLEDDLRGNLAKPIGKLGIEAVTWYRRYILGVDTKIGDEQYHLFHETALHKYLMWLNELFSVKTPELRRVPVIAAMHATFEKNEEAARLFWLHVSRGGVEFETDDPTTVLDEWLKSSKEDGLKFKQAEYYRGCIYAWNASREEKSLTQIKFDKRKSAQTISD